MKIQKITYCLLTLVGFMTITIAEANPTHGELDLAHFLKELTDLNRLVVRHEPHYVTRQFSSYDRKSTDPSLPTEENWFANYDRNQHLRIEENNGRREYVIMETEGPGVVVRFWSANPNEGGIVRFYLDHSHRPALEMLLVDLLRGTMFPFIEPICGVRGKGWNSYFPIPFHNYCKVTLSEGDIYYCINYRTYGKEANIKSFSMDETNLLRTLITETANKLKTPYPIALENSNVIPYETVLSPGGSDSVTLEGPAALCRISCSINCEDIAIALRQCLLEISFDTLAPTVCAPLGDFFGTAPGLNPYQSLPSGVLSDGTMYSQWVMPFRQSAHVTVRNVSDVEVTLTGELNTREFLWTDDTLYFHAKWRSEKNIPTRPFKDWNYIRTAGKGRFCGTMLHITNPVVQWWGEGDEKIYVDNENFPSFFGTGTEDYFGYAWCSSELFTQAFHNQLRCDGPGNKGHTCVSRFHIMDDIPFLHALQFDLEVWHWADTKVTQSVMVYWYATADSKDNFPPIDTRLLEIPTLPKTIQGVEGALEAETLRVVSVSGGIVEPQSGLPWSLEYQLWWQHGKPGDRLTLAFPVEHAGTYEIKAAFTYAPDYGIHNLYINGKPIDGPKDFYAPTVTLAPEINLGTLDLLKGENKLEIEIVGKNNSALPGYMFGLDYLLLSQ